MNRLAAIYNVFDGEENLLSSVESIRDNVDVVIAVQQQVSNYGNQHRINIKNYLKSIKEIDYVLDYHPKLDMLPGHNEFLKRLSGIKKSIELGCTHYFHIDCDEEYVPREFKAAYEKLIRDDNDSSACKIYKYFKFRNTLVIDDSELCVPFIHKIQVGKMRMSPDIKYPVLADNTRRGNPTDNFHLFEEGDIVMHHYSWVRNNISEKLDNSTARHLWQNHRDAIIKSFDDFEVGDNLVRVKFFTNFIVLPESVLPHIPFEEYESVITRTVG